MATAAVSEALLSKGLPAFVPRTSHEATAIRTLIVGTGPGAATLAVALGKAGSHHVVGAMDVERRWELFDVAPEIPWLGPLTGIASAAVLHAVDEILVALPLRSRFDDWLTVQAAGLELGIPVSLRFDLAGGRVSVRSLPDATLVNGDRHPASHGLSPIVKRLFDVVVASAALVAFAPVLVLAGLAVKLTSEGPVFFRQPRVGRGRRVFGMFKFRTMVRDAEQRRGELVGRNDAKGIIFKVENDPRLTAIGPFLRRTSIDELPQLLNVLRGEMSLVGPRPLPTWVYEQIREQCFHRRFSVQAGMTGLWQVHGRPQEYRLMADHDLRYVEHWSFWLDLTILARTIPAVIRRKGAL